nr:VOC family protein [Ferroacidibacillus organovorans]
MVLFLASQGQPQRQSALNFASMGFSHVTLNVSDLERSLAFYVGTIGMKLVHRALQDAYLEWGKAWICLQERPMLPTARLQLGVDHVALYTPQDELQAAVDVLKSANVPIIRGPVERGGGWTVNFLDPDGTQLEFHSGTLGERMKVWK